MWLSFLMVAVAVGQLAPETRPEAARPRFRGQIVRQDKSGPPLTHTPGTHPIFQSWAYTANGPLVCEFQAEPKTEYQVFIGLIEGFWDRPGQRIMDVVVGGRTVATLDSFGPAKNRAHGYLLRGTTNGDGKLHIVLKPSARSHDRNPAACGFLLFPARPALDVDSIVSNRAPEPLAVAATGPDLVGRGAYFAKKSYTPQPLPDFLVTRRKLPEPIFDEAPEFVSCYWKCWELAFSHFRQPPPGSPFVSNYIDEAFCDSLFMFDTSFMTMFCNYAHPYVPGIQSLDNFYCTQLRDGEIVREITEKSGEPAPMSPAGTPDSLNHPIVAWAERESYRITGDRERLALVYEPLVRYYRAMDKIKDPSSGFYLACWASMDNSPRIAGLLCGIDTTAEVVLFARDLAEIAKVLGKTAEADMFAAEARALSAQINARLWDERTGYYYDTAVGGKRHNVRTVATFWPLIAGIPDAARAERLIAHLENPNAFGRTHLVPTLPADEKGYNTMGDYWRGGVWTPINTMVIRGLQRYGKDDLARRIAMNHLKNVAEVFRQTGTIWEFYAPDSVKPGLVDGHPGRRDFVGWSGLGPITYLIEFAIGIQVDAPANLVTWDIRSPQRCGVKRLWFGGKTASLICEAPAGAGEGPDPAAAGAASSRPSDARAAATRPSPAAGPRKLVVTSDGSFHLKVIYSGKSREFDVDANETLEVTIAP